MRGVISLVVFVAVALPGWVNALGADHKVVPLNLPLEGSSESLLEGHVWFLERAGNADVFQAWDWFKRGEFELQEGTYIEDVVGQVPLWIIVPLSIVQNDQSEWVVW